MTSAANPHLAMPVARAGCPLESARCAGILMHGRGRDTDDILQVAHRLALDDVAYLAPAAAGNTWYPMGFMAPLHGNQPWLDHALERIHTLVTELAAQGFSGERVVLLGFSQGACLTLEYCARNTARYGGIIAFTGGLIGPPGSTWPGNGDFAGTPAFLGTSDVDEWVPAVRVRESAAVLEKLGAQVRLQIYPGMQHVICEEEIEEARKVFAAVPENS